MISTKELKRKISKIFFVAILVCFSLLIVFAGSLIYNGLYKKHSKVELFHNRMTAIVKKMSRLIEFVQKIPQDLVYILEFQDVDEQEMKILLESVLFNNLEICGSAIAFEPNQFYKDSLYHATYVYRKGDRNIYTNLNGPEYNYFNKEWYQLPKTLMKPTWSEPYFDTGGGNIFMSTYSIPFSKFDGYKEEFKGIVTVDVSIEELKRNVQSVGKLWNCYTILVSGKGTVLSAPYEEWIFKESIFTLASKLNVPVFSEIGSDLKKGISGTKNLGRFEDQNDWLVFYAIIPINQWGLIMLLPRNDFNKK
jgi:sigma-B regulation protein RsbU (phosphoserine phosphatase)